MKTTQQLIELQRSELIQGHLKEIEDYCIDIDFNEVAGVIALVPELISEVIKLRSALALLASDCDDYGLTDDDAHLRDARALLADAK